MQKRFFIISFRIASYANNAFIFALDSPLLYAMNIKFA